MVAKAASKWSEVRIELIRVGEVRAVPSAMCRMTLIANSRCKMAACTRHSSAQVKTPFSSRMLHGPAIESQVVSKLLFEFCCMKAVTAHK